MNTKVTVVIPAFKAKWHIKDCLASIQTQTVKNDISVIIANDNPGDDYKEAISCYPDLDISFVDTDKNTGPGLARQRGLDACKTDWVTFIDADDIFMGPLAIESLIRNITPTAIEVQGPFFQEVKDHPQGLRAMPRNDVGHPWVFGRLYNVKFLRENDISFSELRAMEDGEFNWKIRMTIEGSPLQINVINEPIYFWRTGSEHSITRIGADEKDHIPQYNFDLCQWGATVASINAIKFCKAKNPFNGSITKFTTEMMISHYFTYIECLARKPIFSEQNLFNAKRFYNEAYKEIESQISKKILSDMYTVQLAGKSQELIGIIPEITFFDFMDKISKENYGGEDEWKEIRSKLPQYIIDNDIKSGVATY